MNEQPNLVNRSKHDWRLRRASDKDQGEVFPTPNLEVAPGEDEIPESVHPYTTVDIDDPDEVGDPVLDRALEFQLR